MSKIFSHTTALCHICMQKVTARVIEKDNSIFMEKLCPDHGPLEVLISSDVEWYKNSMRYVKPGQEPLKRNVSEFKGCPESCGFCPEHQQHTCLPIIEINSACNMSCPICLKDFENQFEMSVEQFSSVIKNLIETEGTMDIINLSGGEPTIHPKLEEIILAARKLGVEQITVSTNGKRLLHDKELRNFFKENKVIAALQFDGFDDDAYRFIRGEALADTKQQIIRIFEDEGVPYSFVVTIAKGVNDNHITEITDQFFKSKALSIMFQPLTFTGSALEIDEKKHRITTADIVKSAEMSRFINEGDINPLPCSHYSCFSLAYYFNLGNNKFLSLKNFFGEDEYLEIIKNKTLPDMDNIDHNDVNQKIYQMWSDAGFCSCSLTNEMMKKIKDILKQINEGGLSKQTKLELGKENMKAIYIHDFMDKYTLDFGRVRKCCNPYAKENITLVPMCSQNVFYQGIK